MNIEFLQKTAIFRGMKESELLAALDAFQAVEREYDKDEIILLAGSVTENMGLVLSGSVTIEVSDLWGNRTILNHIAKGQFFAETYALLEKQPMLVDVVANENCRIMFFKIGSLNQIQSDMALWKVKLIGNMLTISAQKNLHLSGRSFHTSPKSVRGRIMAYLNTVSLQTHTNEFDIPFDRQQLADYLNLDRTALSKELGKMRKEEIIDFRKNHFVIKTRNE